ncbi:flagellar export protein FliJ [Terrihabitans rhizophilus]|jgi:flagellar export protein FliJ|uniref:Flagellar export protein FliJ n=1 Tax=Terrihabitans rhizophilus TaxID=3092662 RepID=A0ABU4RRF1_9HYPH|nr:flagellar export protein FliJ [Terrihabitans sp. PJ23]MDX6807428.1 flagellar export protein FliJ [Terrihabitans sp. PJ23]
MKSRDTMIRLKRFQVDERRRQVGQIEAMVAEFMRIAADLDREIEVEEQRAGIGDVNHFAYPTYARAAAQRRDNLLRSAEELKVQLAEAQAAMEDAQADLEKAEALDARDQRTEAGRETTSRRAS